jgi:hypothetical protein
MENLVKMIATDSNASEISDKIKEILYTKASENIESLKPYVAAAMFGDDSILPDEE